jgi:hypothetical protein
MPLSSEEDEFLEVASDALPRIVELIATFPVEHRAGAFEVAERRYMQAAQDFWLHRRSCQTLGRCNYAKVAYISGTEGDGARN